MVISSLFKFILRESLWMLMFPPPGTGRAQRSAGKMLQRWLSRGIWPGLSGTQLGQFKSFIRIFSHLFVIIKYEGLVLHNLTFWIYGQEKSGKVFIEYLLTLTRLQTAFSTSPC